MKPEILIWFPYSLVCLGV